MELPKVYREKPNPRRIYIMGVRIFPIPKREHPPPIKAKRARSTEKFVAKSSRSFEAVTLISEYKVCHIQPFKWKTMFAENRSWNLSTILKHTRNASRWWQTWTRTKNATRSEKSRRNWSAAWETRSISRCATSHLKYNAKFAYSIEKWALYIVRAANACSFRKEIDSSTRIDMTSCQSRIMWSRRIRPMELDTDRLILQVHSMLRQAQKKKCNTTLEIFQQDSIYRDSLTEIGWDENIMIAYDEIEK